MTFSMTWVPQGDLVVWRAHESSWGSPVPAAPMCLTWVSWAQGLRHNQFPQPNQGRGSVPSSQKGLWCLTSHTPAHLPLTNVPLSSFQHSGLGLFSEPWLLVTLSSISSITDQKAEKWAWKWSILTQFPPRSKDLHSRSRIFPLTQANWMLMSPPLNPRTRQLLAVRGGSQKKNQQDKT